MGKGFTAEKRIQVFNKFNGKCAYCGIGLELEYNYNNKIGLCIDHIIPQNPKNNKIENLFPSCRSCNSQKQNKSIEEFRALRMLRGLDLFFSLEQYNFLLNKMNIDLLKDIKHYKFYFEE